MPPLEPGELGSGEPEGYTGPELSPIATIGGRKRRKSGKRGKRRSSRKSRKYMKKMYRGGNKAIESTRSDEDGSTESNENENENKNENENSQGGGRRKRKGKTRKGKVSKWITHVKNFSRANKMDFRDALKNPKCKAEYHKMK